MKTVHFFLGANSGEGFYSLYDQMLTAGLDDLLILKGGPGCGKSTFMRCVAKAAEEKGEDVVYIHCSGDPASLDGAYFPERRIALVDGTAPHASDPKGHFVQFGWFENLRPSIGKRYKNKRDIRFSPSEKRISL